MREGFQKEGLSELSFEISYIKMYRERAVASPGRGRAHVQNGSKNHNDVFGGSLSDCVWLECRVCVVKWQETKPEN